jgi:hypothetical protein
MSKMLKIVNPLKTFTGYSEVPQVNPMRWRLCLKKDDTVIPQSNWWKCKDFLNDVVVYLRTGKVFSVYSFNNEQKINEEGGYMALKFVAKCFDENLPVLNKYLESKGFPTLTNCTFDGTVDGTEKLLLIPPIYWQNTFYISYITALIRSCCFKKHTDMKHMVEEEQYLKDGKFATFDKYLDTKLIEKMNELVYINYQCSGPGTGYDNTYNIHNAGICTWHESASKHGLST